MLFFAWSLLSYAVQYARKQRLQKILVNFFAAQNTAEAPQILVCQTNQFKGFFKK